WHCALAQELRVVATLGIDSGAERTFLLGARAYYLPKLRRLSVERCGPQVGTSGSPRVVLVQHQLTEPGPDSDRLADKQSAAFVAPTLCRAVPQTDDIQRQRAGRRRVVSALSLDQSASGRTAL